MASDAGWLVMVCNTYREPERELAYVSLLRSQRVGAIVNPIPGQESRNSDYLLESGAAIKATTLTSWQVASFRSAVAAVLSPFLTCEEAYLAAKFFKGLAPGVRLALGDDGRGVGLHAGLRGDGLGVAGEGPLGHVAGGRRLQPRSAQCHRDRRLLPSPRHTTAFPDCEQQLILGECQDAMADRMT